MNMFKPTRAKTIKEYLAAVPKKHKDTIVFMHNFVQNTVPKLKPFFAKNMLGYGSFTYKNYKKEMVEWPIVAIANQKNHISMYVCSVVDGQYVAEKYKSELGRVKVGKSCISFKNLEDVNLSVLRKILKEANKHPGLVPVEKSRPYSS